MTRAAWVVVLAAGTAGCANLYTWDPPAERRVYNQNTVQPPVERPLAGDEYAVRAGDTMYSIAFRHSLDYRELAQWNGIGADYLIRPGQVLKLSGPATSIATAPVAANGAPPATRPQPLPAGTPTPATAAPAGAPVPLPPPSAPLPGAIIPPPGEMTATLPEAPAASALPGATSATPVAPAIPAPAAPAPNAPVTVAAIPPPTAEAGGPYRWQWPVQGTVVRGFNPAAGSKGLDFAGEVGQAVFAAAPGKVVYSGSALKGYGELIIIKHDDLRLSAYGYNRTRLVKEGDMVRGGQQIAELGLGPESRPILHFEIRERGQPVNPLPYLPPRSDGG